MEILKIISKSINLIEAFIEEVFVKDDDVIRRSTINSIKELGLTEFKKKNKINF